jgi:hypothetical protein
MIPEKPFSQTKVDLKKRTISRQQRASSPCEWTSAEITSAMRHRSVEDLYYHYGIQRLAGLVSSENIASDPEETPQSPEEQRNCHVCSCVNFTDSIKCRCGHILCERCHCLAPEAIATSDGSADCAEISPRVKRGIYRRTNKRVNLRIVKCQSRVMGTSIIRRIIESNKSRKSRRGRLKP